MEVASPIPFNVTAGAKRRLACSPLDTPGLDAHDNYGMDDSGFGQTFKRRRCDDMEMIQSNQQPLAFNNTFGHQSVFGNKRHRSEETHGSQDENIRQLRTLLDRQSAEIEKLKGEKESIQNGYKDLAADHEKTVNENKMLKKVLTIKQERQDQFVAELENARRYKEQADQVIAVLKQHLAQQQSQGNVALGFNSGNPHVF